MLKPVEFPMVLESRTYPSTKSAACSAHCGRGHCRDGGPPRSHLNPDPHFL